MSAHATPDRQLTDAELRGWTVQKLYDFAAECDVEPADETACDACAAYLIGQEKERSERVVKTMTDEDLARRACVVLRAAVRDAGRYFARVDFGELNDVMLEAERRGW